MEQRSGEKCESDSVESEWNERCKWSVEKKDRNSELKNEKCRKKSIPRKRGDGMRYSNVLNRRKQSIDRERERERALKEEIWMFETRWIVENNLETENEKTNDEKIRL